jgi:simple sugar transport system permease protein
MLVLGTFGAGWAGYQWGPWAGLFFGVCFGALGGLLHAVATVTFAVDQIVSGVAINILALGVTQYLASILFTGVEGGGPTQSPPMESMGSITVPGLSSFFNDLAAKEWFFVSDLAALGAALTTQVSYLTIIAVLLVIATFYILWRTAFGLRLRSAGEAPHAAATLGVKVKRYKYAAVVMSGCLAGVGGVFLAEVLSNIYREGQVAGRGYIGLAAMIFGNWRPGGLVAGAGLFGYTDALQLRGSVAVHALLAVAALALLLWSLWLFIRSRSYLGGGVALAFAALFAWWYLATDELPPQATFVTPYVTTLVVLALATQRLRMPAADGIPYREGED